MSLRDLRIKGLATIQRDHMKKLNSDVIARPAEQVEAISHKQETASPSARSDIIPVIARSRAAATKQSPGRYGDCFASCGGSQ